MKLLFTLLATCSMLLAQAQGTNVRYLYFDKDWKPAPAKKGDYLQRISKLNDSTFQRTTYNTPGPLISQLRYRDEEGKMLHGVCVYYKPDGYLDSAGEYRNGVPTGSWYYYDAKGNAFKRKDYLDGRLVKDTLFTTPSQEEIRKTLAAAGQLDSEFEGGSKGWAAFLHDNMSYPPAAEKTETQGTVLLQFKVDEHGKIRDPLIWHSVDYYLDEEALRLTRKSPLWKPATKAGKPVASFKLQPVIFQLTGKQGRS